ncbi:MAG: hypothetical protein FJ109_08280 [Deltaproteobacteria bacterium]|nr:hypothetical protein [Deltaproteobacteria bacterium]
MKPNMKKWKTLLLATALGATGLGAVGCEPEGGDEKNPTDLATTVDAAEADMVLSAPRPDPVGDLGQVCLERWSEMEALPKSDVTCYSGCGVLEGTCKLLPDNRIGCVSDDAGKAVVLSAVDDGRQLEEASYEKSNPCWHAECHADGVLQTSSACPNEGWQVGTTCVCSSTPAELPLQGAYREFVSLADAAGNLLFAGIGAGEQEGEVVYGALQRSGGGTGAAFAAELQDSPLASNSELQLLPYTMNPKESTCIASFLRQDGGETGRRVSLSALRAPAGMVSQIHPITVPFVVPGLPVDVTGYRLEAAPNGQLLLLVREAGSVSPGSTSLVLLSALQPESPFPTGVVDQTPPAPALLGAVAAVQSMAFSFTIEQTSPDQTAGALRVQAWEMAPNGLVEASATTAVLPDCRQGTVHVASCPDAMLAVCSDAAGMVRAAEIEFSSGTGAFTVSVSVPGSLGSGDAAGVQCGSRALSVVRDIASSVGSADVHLSIVDRDFVLLDDAPVLPPVLSPRWALSARRLWSDDPTGLVLEFTYLMGNSDLPDGVGRPHAATVGFPVIL